MSVGVIIPLYNGAKWINEALDSVLSQDILPKEIIVVDDGSTDSSPNQVQSYTEVKLLKNNGKGSSFARNIGFQHTNSKFIAFLDQDDVWHPSHLRMLVQTLENYPKANTAVSLSSCFTKGIPDYDISSDKHLLFTPWTRFPFTMGIEGPSLALIRREAILEVGMWEECATGMGDALIFLKLSVLYPIVQRTIRTTGKRIHASQQWLKVRELGTSYLDFRFEVMKRALEFRCDYNPQDLSLSIYKRRLEMLKCLREITHLIQIDQIDSILPFAQQLETKLFDDPIELVPHVFYCLMGALFKTYNIEVLRRERNKLFTRLLKIWPNDAKRTKNTLRKILSEQPRIS